MAGYNLSALANALGDYHRVHDRNVLAKRIRQRQRQTNEDPITFWDIVNRRYIKDQEAVATMDVDIQVQRAATAVTRQSDDVVTMDGFLRQIRDFESTFTFNPYALENTWLDHVNDQRAIFGDMPSYQDVEFVPWLTQYLVDHFVEKFERISVFNAVYNAAAAYAADGSGTNDSWYGTFNGIKKQIADAITASDLTAFAGAVITNANAFDQLEAIGKSVSTHLDYEDLFLLASRQVCDWYNHDFRTTYPGSNGNLHPGHKRRTLLDRENITIIPTPELSGSQRVIIVPRNHISLLFDERQRNTPLQMIYMPVSTKEIEVTMKMGAGVAFGRWDEVTVNDQA